MIQSDETSFTRVAFGVALGAFLLIGGLDAAFGPLLRPMSAHFGVSLPVAGTVISVYFAGALISVPGVLAGFRRLPPRWLAMPALAVVGAGCLVIALAGRWGILVAGVLVTGFGFGATDFSLNQMMARTTAAGRAARLNVLNAAFGAGAVLGPLAVGFLGGQILTWGFAVSAGVACLLAVGLRGITAGPPQTDSAQAAAGPPPVSAGELPPVVPPMPPVPAGVPPVPVSVPLGDPDGPEDTALAAPWTRRHAPAAVAALAYALYAGCETSVAGWIPAHLISLGYSVSFSAWMASAFWAALTIGRVVAAPFSRRVPASRLVLLACPFFGVALALTAFAPVAPLAYAAAGLAAAPIFPMGLAWITGTVPAGQHATSAALIGAMAGGIACPAAVAAVVSAAGIRDVPVVLALLGGCTWLAFVAFGKVGRASWAPA